MVVKGFIVSLIISLLLILFAGVFNNYYLLLVLSIGGIIFFNLKAVFEEVLKKYVFYGFSVQAAYVLLDASTSVLSGKSHNFAFIQLFNFFIAGLLLVVSVRGKSFKDLKMNNYYLLGILVSCLALAGVPGFNLFVGEYYMYIFAYDINPLLLCFCFICSILTLVNYLKLVNYSCNAEHRETPSALSKISIIVLSSACIILGIIPSIQKVLIEVLL